MTIRRAKAVGLALVGLMAFSAQSSVQAEVTFERLEFTLNGPVDGCLHGDIDGDGDSDLLFLRSIPLGASSMHWATYVPQSPTGRFDYPGRQTFSLRDSSGVYELANVADGDLLELVQMTGDGVRYFSLENGRFDTTPKTLFRPPTNPHLPTRALPMAWDFGWPLLPGAKECITIPFVDGLEVWHPDQSGQYILGASVASGTLCDMGPRAETPSYGFGLPRILGPVSPASLDVYLQSGAGWQGLHRSDLQQVDFTPRLAFGSEVSPETPLLMPGPQFVSGATMTDLNGDGSPDAIRWTNPGGLDKPSCVVSIYFGPFNQSLPATPHSLVTIEGVVGYPVFGDMDGDGRQDMLLCALELGPVAMAKVFVMKRVTVHLMAFRQETDNTFPHAPSARLKFEYRMDFDRSQPIVGPLVQFVDDLNGDGTDDFVTQTGSDRLSVYLTDPDGLLDNDPQRLRCPDAISIEVLDLDGDGHSDIFMLHQPTESAQKITAFLIR